MAGATLDPQNESDAALRIVNADLAPPSRREPVLTGVSLRLARGEVGVLLGANGSGKTTLLRCAAGLWPLRSGSLFPPVDRGFDMRRAGLLVEDPASQFTAGTVAGEIEFGLENLGLSTEEIVRRRDAALDWLGLRGVAGRDPARLSPGEQELVLVAAALAPGPSLLLLDDPFLYLGPAEARRTWATVVGGVRSGVLGAVLLAGHDPELTAAADRVGVLFAGRLLGWEAPPGTWRNRLPPELKETILGEAWVSDAS